MTEAQTKHFNIRKDRVPRFEAVMPRIRAHYPYKDAGLSWILMDALEAFADSLDAKAAAEPPPRVAATVFNGSEGVRIDWTCPNCDRSNLTRPNDSTPTCGLCSTEVEIEPNTFPGRDK